MTEPYYDQDGITIYLGDCLDVLPALSPVEIVFTSPPYNLGTGPGGRTGKKNNTKWERAYHPGGVGYGYADHDDAMPLEDYELWQRSVLSALWEHTTGAIFYNHKPRPWQTEIWLPLRLNPGLPLRQIIVWARSGGINFNVAHYVPMYEWILLFAREGWKLRDQPASGVGDLWSVPQETRTEHPAPFPVGLPARAIETTGARSILDPFMGSGTTLRAAKDAGIRGIGIEISERYCELAVRRLAQGVFV